MYNIILNPCKNQGKKNTPAAANSPSVRAEGDVLTSQPIRASFS